MKIYEETDPGETGETVTTYYCGRCDTEYDVSDSPFTSARVIYGPSFIAGHDPIDGEDRHCEYVYIEIDGGTEEDAWYCYSGCFHHDEGAAPELKTNQTVNRIFVCGECGTRYESDEYDDAAEAEAEAIECCKP